MQPMNGLVYVESYWLQPKAMQKRFELRTENDVFASLEYPSVWRYRANAETADGHWVFEPQGFWQTTIQVRAAEQQAPVGLFTFRWSGTSGTLQLAGGKTYHWKVANFWATQFIWEEVEGQTLLHYQSGSGSFKLGEIFKVQARMRLAPEAQADRNIPLLVTLGWYLIIRHHDNSAAAATA